MPVGFWADTSVRLLVLGLTLMASSVGRAQDGNDNSFCAWSTHGPDTLVWQVDEDAADLVYPSGQGLTDVDLRRQVDSALQVWARSGRGRIRHRVLDSTLACDPNATAGQGCIAARNNTAPNQDAGCAGQKGRNLCTGPLDCNWWFGEACNLQSGICMGQCQTHGDCLDKETCDLIPPGDGWCSVPSTAGLPAAHGSCPPLAPRCRVVLCLDNSAMPYETGHWTVSFSTSSGTLSVWAMCRRAMVSTGVALARPHQHGRRANRSGPQTDAKARSCVPS